MIIKTYPLCSTTSLVSNNSRTERLNLRFSRCPENLGFNEDAECLSCYCQPYISGDKFTFQFHNEFETQVQSIELFSKDSIFIANVPVYQFTGYLTEYGAFTNVVFDMDTLSVIAGVDCFRVKVNFQYTQFISEPFCKAKCDESTLLICSDYSGLDCNSNIYSYNIEYGAFPLPKTVYSNCMRIKAVLEKTNIGIDATYEEITTTISNTIKHTQTKITDIYELRVWGIPEWQVDRLKAALSGNNLTINYNGDVYNLSVRSGLDKNANLGNLWYPNIKLDSICVKKLNNC